MSDFISEKCGTEIIDSDDGYLTGCEHYPVEQVTKKDLIELLSGEIYE